MPPATSSPTPFEIEAQHLLDAESQRQAQNAKAHQVRLDNIGKRDPMVKKLLIVHRQQAVDLGTAKASIASLTAELDGVKTQAADESAKLRTALDEANARAVEIGRKLAESRGDSTASAGHIAAMEAELTKLRADLAAAPKKPKPAGGQ